ncbi:MAG: hypothetical protein KGL95_05385 [Patescibacteria group bacterium]|nr:hypothetical protein [Patescibacteria group bacterium]
MSEFRTFQDILSLDDPAPDWMWTLDILNIPGMPALENLYIQAVSFPPNQLQSEQRYRGGLYVHFPKFADVQGMNVSFYETQGYIVSQFLNQWFSLIFHDDGTFGIPVDYMGSAVLRLYDFTGQKRLTITAAGAWPRMRTNYDLMYNQSNMTHVSCDFAIIPPKFSTPDGLSGSLSGLNSVNLVSPIDNNQFANSSSYNLPLQTNTLNGMLGHI